MTEIMISLISAFSALGVAFITMKPQRDKDRQLATETTSAKNAEIAGLKARLEDCHKDRDWLRRQLEEENSP